MYSSLIRIVMINTSTGWSKVQWHFAAVQLLIFQMHLQINYYSLSDVINLVGTKQHICAFQIANGLGTDGAVYDILGKKSPQVHLEWGLLWKIVI